MDWVPDIPCPSADADALLEHLNEARASTNASTRALVAQAASDSSAATHLAAKLRQLSGDIAQLGSASSNLMRQDAVVTLERLDGVKFSLSGREESQGAGIP